MSQQQQTVEQRANQLMRAMQAGTMPVEDGIEHLIRLLRVPVIRHLYLNYDLRREDPDELFQLFSIKLFEHYDEYDPEQPFLRWAHRIARNILFDRSKKRQRYGEALLAKKRILEAMRLFAGGHKSKAEEMVILNDVVMRLTESERKIVTMFSEGHTEEEIAKRLQMKRPTLQKLLKKTFDKLREMLEGVQ